MKTINWTEVSEAIENYTRLGFEYIETPWMVESTTASITCPDLQYHDRLMEDGSVLVASAEQGFLQLKRDGKLDGVNYVSASPCFRLMDSTYHDDGLHQETFFKVELFCICETKGQAEFAARELVVRARNFMSRDAEFVHMDDGSIDLELNGVEIGSYGARHDPLVGHWAYGTGLALPRLDMAREMKREDS